MTRRRGRPARLARSRGRPPGIVVKPGPRQGTKRKTKSAALWESLMSARAAVDPWKNIECSFYLKCLAVIAGQTPDGWSCMHCQFKHDAGRAYPFSDSDNETDELIGIARLLQAVFFEKGNEYEADV